jgi:hypothetical protein
VNASINRTLPLALLLQFEGVQAMRLRDAPPLNVDDPAYSGCVAVVNAVLAIGCAKTGWPLGLWSGRWPAPPDETAQWRQYCWGCAGREYLRSAQRSLAAQPGRLRVGRDVIRGYERIGRVTDTRGDRRPRSVDEALGRASMLTSRAHSCLVAAAEGGRAGAWLARRPAPQPAPDARALWFAAAHMVITDAAAATGQAVTLLAPSLMREIAAARDAR